MTTNPTAIAILVGSFLIMILLRIHIAYAVGIASTLCLLYLGIPLSNICQQMVKGLFSFSLMAVPFFITMGCLMGQGGISDKLIWQWSISLRPISLAGSPVRLRRTRHPSES